MEFKHYYKSRQGEMVNLLENPSPQTEAVAGDLRMKLEEWATSAKPLASHDGELQQEDTKKKLRSLGYVK